MLVNISNISNKMFVLTVKGDSSPLIYLSSCPSSTFLTFIGWARVKSILWLSQPEISIRQSQISRAPRTKPLDPSTLNALNAFNK